MSKYPDYEDWKVQLAYTYTGNELRQNEKIALGQKINGVRATYFAGKLVSRGGKIFAGMDDLNKILRQIVNEMIERYDRDFIFDGELRLLPKYEPEGATDNDIFKMSVGIANSVNNLSEKFKLGFIIFDVLPAIDFIEEREIYSYFTRFEWLNAVKDLCVNTSRVTTVPILYVGTDHNKIIECSILAEKNGWEGIMINRDSPYAFTRTKALLKVKNFKTIDLKIVGWTQGTGKYAHTLGALMCQYKDNIVYVGTGFDDLQRDYLYDQRDHIEGKICEVKYKDITCDKHTGKESLQFPVFMYIKEDKFVADV